MSINKMEQEGAVLTDGNAADAPEREKPDCRLIGENGNIFNLMGIAARTLRKNDMSEQATEMIHKVTNSGSYAEALMVIGQYVNITGPDMDEMDEQRM